ncbi:hypothetical protein ACFQ1S_38355, partial [Kibdelosporangium lantanae]
GAAACASVLDRVAAAPNRHGIVSHWGLQSPAAENGGLVDQPSTLLLDEDVPVPFFDGSAVLEVVPHGGFDGVGGRLGHGGHPHAADLAPEGFIAAAATGRVSVLVERWRGVDWRD